MGGEGHQTSGLVATHEAGQRSRDQTGSVVTITVAIAGTINPIRLAGILEFRGTGPRATGREVQSCTPSLMTVLAHG